MPNISYPRSRRNNRSRNNRKRRNNRKNKHNHNNKNNNRNNNNHYHHHSSTNNKNNHYNNNNNNKNQQMEYVHVDNHETHYSPPPRRRSLHNNRNNHNNHNKNRNNHNNNNSTNNMMIERENGLNGLNISCSNPNKKYCSPWNVSYVIENNNLTKRRQSYSETTPEAQQEVEIEDNNADLIGGTESVSSQSMIINDNDRNIYHNDNGNHSDSNICCNISCDNKENDNNNNNNNNVYIHNNQRTKQNYYYQRKTITPSPSNNTQNNASSLSGSLDKLATNDNNNKAEEKELELDDKDKEKNNKVKDNNNHNDNNNMIANGVLTENNVNNQYFVENNNNNNNGNNQQQPLIYKPLSNGTNVIDSTSFESRLRHRRNSNNNNNNNCAFNNNNNSNNPYPMNNNAYNNIYYDNGYYQQQQFQIMYQNMNQLNMSSYNIPHQEIEGECFICIDVECAATGYGHFDSKPCRIAVVDFFGQIIFDEICKVPNIMDPLTEFTGLSIWEINEKGKELSYVLDLLHELLLNYQKIYKYGVTIIGQSLVMDLIWTKLRKGIHYQRTIDIAHKFKTQNQKWSKFQYYALRQVAWCLLGKEMNDKYHDPTEDAQITIKLYRDFCLDSKILNLAKDKLKRTKQQNQLRDFRINTKFKQCSGMYSPLRCHCGQTTAADCHGVEDIDKLRKLYDLHQTKPIQIKQPIHTSYNYNPYS